MEKEPSNLARGHAVESRAEINDRHIVDVMIEERAERLSQLPLVWPLARQALYPLLKYRSAVQMADAVAEMTGRGTFEHLSQLLDLRLQLTGESNIPREGRFLLVSNHPTGIADGVAVYDALKNIRPDMCFFANRDALRINPGLDDIIIPIEWVEDERSAAKTREMVKRMVRAFRDENALVMFPSGKLAKPTFGGLREHNWMSTVINIARRNKAPIVPLHMSARNSWLYYVFYLANDELRDITLFNELLNKTNYPFRMTFGAPIAPEALAGDAEEMTARLKDHVEYGLASDPAAVFGAPGTG